MYMPGRLRTASRPSRTVMSLAPYDSAPSRLLMRGGSCRHTPTGAEKLLVRGKIGRGRTTAKWGRRSPNHDDESLPAGSDNQRWSAGSSGPKPEANALHLRASRQGFESSAQLGFEPPQ